MDSAAGAGGPDSGAMRSESRSQAVRRREAARSVVIICPPPSVDSGFRHTLAANLA
jgi:hypothetical protein